MKCIFTFFYACIFFALPFSASCKERDYGKIDCSEVVFCYEEQGFEVWHNDGNENFDYACVVKAWLAENPSNYIYFTFFKTEEEARAFAKNNQPNALIFLFILLNGETKQRTVARYNLVVVEYEDKELFKPFQTRYLYNK